MKHGCKSTTVAFGRISKTHRWNCREIAAMTGNIVFKALLKLMWNHCCKQLQATRLAEKTRDHSNVWAFWGKKLLGRHACRADTFAREPARGGKQHLRAPLNFGYFWILGFGNWSFGHLDFGFRIFDFGFWIWNFWNLVFSCILDFGFGSNFVLFWQLNLYRYAFYSRLMMSYT